MGSHIVRNTLPGIAYDVASHISSHGFSIGLLFKACLRHTTRWQMWDRRRSTGLIIGISERRKPSGGGGMAKTILKQHGLITDICNRSVFLLYVTDI